MPPGGPGGCRPRHAASVRGFCGAQPPRRLRQALHRLAAPPRGRPWWWRNRPWKTDEIPNLEELLAPLDIQARETARVADCARITRENQKASHRLVAAQEGIAPLPSYRSVVSSDLRALARRRSVESAPGKSIVDHVSTGMSGPLLHTAIPHADEVSAGLLKVSKAGPRCPGAPAERQRGPRTGS